MNRRTAGVVASLEMSGVVTRRALVAAGLHPGLPDREICAGRWRRLAPGIYLISPGAPARDQVRFAALVHAGEAAFLCGADAAQQHQARDVPHRDVVDVLHDHARRVRRSPGARYHRTRSMPPVTTRQGWPVVAAPDAVVGAARRAPSLRAARGVVLAATCDRLCTVDQLEDALTRGGSEGWAQAARAVLNARWGAWSAPEAEAADLLIEAAQQGLFPPFLLNPEVWVGDVKLGIPDIWVVGRAFGGEVDSVEWHSGAQLSATFDRHEEFVAHGLALLHRTPSRIRSRPDQYVRDMVRRAAEGGGEPAGLRVVARGPLLPEPHAAPRRKSRAA